MGSSSSGLNVNPDKKVVFLEDLTKEEKAKMLRDKGENMVYGLQNLGNTCYLNSTLQCLGRVPELRQSLEQLAEKKNGNNNYYDMNLNFTQALGGLYKQLDYAHDTVVPETVVGILRTLNPLFAESDKGHYKQQDAEECWSLVLNTIRDYLTNPNNEEKFSSNLIDELFGIEIQIQLKNIEEPTEIRTTKEIIYKLPCYIDNSTTELVEGLKASLKENVELTSEFTGQNAFFEKTQKLNRLPPYLTLQFMRFFWKQANVSTNSKAGKAKILKSVMFSKIIDLYELCSDETKEVLNLGRGIETKMLKEDKDFRIESVTPIQGKEMIPTGRYQLIAILTHQGRSSESGHYIGWVNKTGDKWTKYDDDVISTVNVSDILELKGGGDWPMAYICIYKRLEVPFIEL